jgi:hypothetical protein
VWKRAIAAFLRMRRSKLEESEKERGERCASEETLFICVAESGKEIHVQPIEWPRRVFKYGITIIKYVYQESSCYSR